MSPASNRLRAYLHLQAVQTSGSTALRGFLGISEDVPVGYKEIRVYFKIDADVSDEQKDEMIRMGQKYSPVYNTIAKSAQVSVRLDK
jgi:hypothetical protein